MKSKLFLCGLLAMSLTIFTSCKKEGCTDIDAENFCEDCNEDDNSCRFKGEVVFWYNQATSQALGVIESTSLTYFLDGQVVGSSAANVYWTGAPDCGQSGSVTTTKDLGNVKNKAYSYIIKDQTGFELWSGVANFTANTCTKLELKP